MLHVYPMTASSSPSLAHFGKHPMVRIYSRLDAVYDARDAASSVSSGFPIGRAMTFRRVTCMRYAAIKHQTWILERRFGSIATRRCPDRRAYQDDPSDGKLSIDRLHIKDPRHRSRTSLSALGFYKPRLVPLITFGRSLLRPRNSPSRAREASIQRIPVPPGPSLTVSPLGQRTTLGLQGRAGSFLVS